jgi:energy-coupling factor transporter ATP-binding protein EcfA2
MPSALIEWQGLTFQYSRAESAVLQGVHLSISEGDFVLVAGPSGAGKSTLLRTMNALVPHFSGGRISGRVQVAGRNPIEEGPRTMSRVVGFVQQDPEAQFVVDTVEDELAFAMENSGWPQERMQQRVEQVLDQLGITPLRTRRIHSLSAGQKQRVAIGSALTLQPQVLVLDEPTSQLDPEAAEDVLTTLRALNRRLGLTVVLSEHRLERVVPYVDRVIYLPGSGQAPFVGPPREVLPEMPFGPPVVELATALSWKPVPLTVEETRPFAAQLKLRPAGSVHIPSYKRPIVEVHNLWYDYYGVGALRGIDLRARPGELIALTGRNGSGKTTLLKHLVGLLQPKQGEVFVHGLDTRLASVQQLIRRVGYVPQNPSSLLFADTVRQELEFTRRAHGMAPADCRQWLGMLGLEELGEQYPRDLSVGERQRVALASILIAEPSTLLLDEPTRGLDPLEKQALAAFLRAQTAEGRTVILATHDVELAAQCAQRIVVIDEGSVVADGPAGEVMSQLPLYSPQMNQLYGDPRLLSVQDVLGALQ